MPFDAAYQPPKPSSDPVSDLDAKTYAAVKVALASGSPVSRDFQTGAIVPAHLKGTLYSARDLLAARFSEIDFEIARFEKGRRRGR